MLIVMLGDKITIKLKYKKLPYPKPTQVRKQRILRRRAKSCKGTRQDVLKSQAIRGTNKHRINYSTKYI